MKKLNENWLTNGLIDFEYKKYLLLAYLKWVDAQFTSSRLYPSLGELVIHYRNMESLKARSEAVRDAFPRELDLADMKNFILKYKEAVQDDAIMKEIHRILDYSLPVLKKYLEEGKEIYDWVESQVAMWPLGIVPLEQNFGYLFIRNGEEKRTTVYEYKLSLLQTSTERYRSLRTRYLANYATGISITYEHIKIKLLNRFNLQRPPAVYVLESELKLPLQETLLPIGRRMLASRLLQFGNK